MAKTMIAKVNGVGRVNGRISKKVLERNAMDILTCLDLDFDECQEFVEEADSETLATFLRVYDLAEDGFEDIIREFTGLEI